MYKIEKKDYGFKLTFSDFIKMEEMESWLIESKTHLKSAPKTYGVFVDMRGLKPVPPEAQKAMEAGQKLYKDMGMVRSVVVLDNPLITLQFKRIAKETGIYQWERYIDSTATPKWEQIGIDWIANGIDPDAQ